MHVWQQSVMTSLGAMASVFVGAGLGGCIGLLVFTWLTTPFPK